MGFKQLCQALAISFISFQPLPVAALDYDSLSGLLSLESCETALGLLTKKTMPVESLYQQQGGSCGKVTMSESSSSGTYYGDSSCQQNIEFQSTSTAMHCIEVLNTGSYGNDPAVVAETGIWRLSPWTRLDVSVMPINDNSQPYESREIYKTVASETRGNCALEMRVFKKHPTAINTKPLLLIHGGSWKHRRGGAIGLQSQLSHYTEKGFAVFSPFYRLTGTATEGNPDAVEGGAACSGASGSDILQDVTDALLWVQGYGGRYQVDTTAIAVAGQSAGGHLAAHLAMNHPDAITRGLLLYPPTDFAYFVSEYQEASEPEETEGLSALEGFLGRSLDEVSPDDADVVQNSFPPKIAQNPQAYPPLFAIHGAADTLVPVSQSTRLCNARSGDPENGVVPTEFDPISQAFDCTGDSELRIITDADHILDFCLGGWSVLFGEGAEFCPAGGDTSQEAARIALTDGIAWLATGNNTEVATSSDSNERENDSEAQVASEQESRESSSGGGAWSFTLLLLLAFRSVVRGRRVEAY